MKIIPTVDFVFKKLLGSADHPNLTKSFLNGLMEHMGKPLVQEVTILNPFSSADYRMGRDIVLDVHVKDEQGREYQVEMQTRSGLPVFGTCRKTGTIVTDYRRPWLARRMTHNASRLFDNAFPKGDEYKQERPVLTTWLLNEVLVPEHDWFVDYQLRSPIGDCLGEDLQIVLLEKGMSPAEVAELTGLSEAELPG